MGPHKHITEETLRAHIERAEAAGIEDVKRAAQEARAALDDALAAAQQLPIPSVWQALVDCATLFMSAEVDLTRDWRGDPAHGAAAVRSANLSISGHEFGFRVEPGPGFNSEVEIPRARYRAVVMLLPLAPAAPAAQEPCV